MAVPRPLINRQWRALRSDGWDLCGLTTALARSRADPSDRIIGVTFDDGYSDFLGVVDLLSAHNAQATLYLPTSQLDTSDPPDTPWLSWEEVAALPRDLVEIGSHAHVHRPLDVLSLSDIDREVGHSRRLLIERLGVKPASFCYPNGYSNRLVRDAVCAAGYTNACVVGRRLADANGDPYAVPRMQVTPEHHEAEILKLVVAGEKGWVPQLKRMTYPAWHLVRLAVYRRTGRILT